MNKIFIHFSQVYEALSLLDQTAVQAVADVLKKIRLNGGTVYLCGNGGSHSTASHFANDLSKMGRMRAICLGDSVSITTAYGNDEGWENMYASALTGKLHPNDVVIGISCSGNSMNVVNALREGRLAGATTIGLTGMNRQSQMWKFLPDMLVQVYGEDIRVQEDVHLIICHAIMRAMQENG